MSQWYSSAIPDIWLILMVPIFAMALAVFNRADWRSTQTVFMVLVASAGYTVNYFMANVSGSKAVGTAM